MGKFLLMASAPDPGPWGRATVHVRPGPSARPQGPGPGAGAMSKNLPMKELAHEQELAHSLTCRGGVGWVGGGDDFRLSCK